MVRCRFWKVAARVGAEHAGSWPMPLGPSGSARCAASCQRQSKQLMVSMSCSNWHCGVQLHAPRPAPLTRQSRSRQTPLPWCCGQRALAQRTVGRACNLYVQARATAVCHAWKRNTVQCWGGGFGLSFATTSNARLQMQGGPQNSGIFKQSKIDHSKNTTVLRTVSAK